MGSVVVHIIHNLELFIAYRALSSQSKIVHVIHNSELCKAFGAMAT